MTYDIIVNSSLYYRYVDKGKYEVILSSESNGGLMKKYYYFLMGCILSSFAYSSHYCPDPENTSLRWGVPPSPWVANPLSPNRPQGEDGTHFMRANILVVGPYGRGVVCTYHISIGDYSIWWPAMTKIPAPSDYRWIAVPGGFACSQGISECSFEVLN